MLRLHGCALGIDHVEEGTACGILQVGLYAEMAGQTHEEDEMEIVEGFRGGVKPLQATEKEWKDVAMALLAQGVMEGFAKERGDGGLMGMAGEAGEGAEEADALEVLQGARGMVVPLDGEGGEGLEIGGLRLGLGAPDCEGDAALCLCVEGEDLGAVGVAHLAKHYCRRGEEHELVDN